MNISKKEYLSNVLKSYRMSHIDALLKKHQARSREIKEELEAKYLDNIYSPFSSGSYAKHTAINSKFDLDVVLPVKRGAFATLEEMFNDIFGFLEEKYSNEATVRKQKVSIGIIFNPDKEGEVVNIDIVPGRETSQDDYTESKSLNLFFNQGSGLFSTNSYLKTNIQAQIDKINAKNNERKIIRLLKIWKASNNENYKSFLLELFVIKAFENIDTSGSLWQKLKAVLIYIKDNVEVDGFKLNDPGNSNNNVLDSLDSYEKGNLGRRMDVIVSRIEDNSENIKNYFPINKEYEEIEENKYKIKKDNSVSIPPNNQRFG